MKKILFFAIFLISAGFFAGEDAYAGAEHNVINTGAEDLKLYTIYSPAHHQDGIARATKEEAMANEAEFDGVTTE